MSDKVKKPLYKKWWFILIIIIVIAGIGGAISSKDDEPKKVGSTSSDTKEAEDKKDSKENKGPTIFNVGDIIEADGYKITVNGTRTLTQDSTGFQKADEGKEYFLVNVTIENISDEDKAISSIMMFKVVDQNGKSYDQSLFTEAEGQLDGTIAPTRKITGEYCVEVPQGTTGLELEFQDLFSDQVIVKLN